MSSQKRLTKNEQDELEYKEIREYKSRFSTQTFYVISACGILLVIVGSYLTFVGHVAVGTSTPGRSGMGGGQIQVLNGPSILIMGLLICIIPIGAFISYIKTKWTKK